MNNFGHLMVDIETLSDKSYAVITSIAAVEFDLSGNTGREFSCNISVNSSLKAGLNIDGETLKWWMTRPDEDSRKKMFENPLALANALNQFRGFINKMDVETLQLWGNPALFDLGLIRNAYNILEQDFPWSFRNERDVRTLVSFYPNIKKETEFIGLKHDPVADCKHQIRYLCNIISKLQVDHLYIS